MVVGGGFGGSGGGGGGSYRCDSVLSITVKRLYHFQGPLIPFLLLIWKYSGPDAAKLQYSQ